MSPTTNEIREEKLRLWHPDGREHRIVVLFAPRDSGAILGACYDEGCAEVESGTQIVQWCASYLPPNKNDKGEAHMGNGRIDLDIPSLRGIGLGSLLMRPLVSWIKSHALDVPIGPINLSADDAKSPDERHIRNRFYEKLGFKFKYEDAEQTWGESLPMSCSGLLVPNFCLSQGWKVETITGAGQVF